MASRDRNVTWPNEMPTPTCNLLQHTMGHWRQYERNYRNLARRLGRDSIAPQRFSVDTGSVHLYREVDEGRNGLLWYPKGIELFTELFPFFVKRRLGMMMPQSLGRFLMELKEGGDDAWIVCSGKQAETAIGNDKAEGSATSGVYPRIPTAVQWAYIVALILSRQEDRAAAQDPENGLTVAECTFPFVSYGLSELRFVRSSTWLMEDVFVGMAYLPGVALFFDAFSADTSPPNLITADAVLL